MTEYSVVEKPPTTADGSICGGYQHSVVRTASSPAAADVYNVPYVHSGYQQPVVRTASSPATADVYNVPYMVDAKL